MKPIFVDTSALIALGNKRDAFHEQAIAIKYTLQQAKRNFVTTNAVLLEFGSAFSAIPLRQLAVQMIEAIQHSNKWDIIIIDSSLTNKGIELYKKMQDKAWGLVDCTSIIVAINIGITEIFSTDHHFEQAGFTILLK